jgi:hypothetical protein
MATDPSPTAPPPPFGVLLQRHRLAAGPSQEALAERAGVSAPSATWSAASAGSPTRRRSGDSSRRSRGRPSRVRPHPPRRGGARAIAPGTSTSGRPGVGGAIGFADPDHPFAGALTKNRLTGAGRPAAGAGADGTRRPWAVRGAMFTPLFMLPTRGWRTLATARRAHLHTASQRRRATGA